MIASKFQKRMDDLSQWAAANSIAADGRAGSKWLASQFSGSEKPINLADMPEVQKQFFDRRDLDDTIKQAYTGNGQFGDFISACAQVDWLAAMQREFQQRHASRLQLVGIHTARLENHGDAEGIIKAGIFRRATQFSDQGST